MKPLLIAHRGDTVNLPENTIPAFSSAFAKGADGIECDVQFENKKLIVVHDYLFDRKKQYPLLSEVLELFSQKGRLEIEIKCMDTDFLPDFKLLLSQYKNLDYEITTSVYPLVPYLRKEFQKSSLGIIFHDYLFEDWMTPKFISLKVVQWMKLFKAKAAHLPWKIINNELIEKLHDNNFIVHSHIFRINLDSEIKIYQEMLKMGIDQATFDDIALVEKIK